MKRVIILGASGHAKVIADIIKSSGDEIIGFLDDNLDIQGSIVFDNKKVLGTIKNDIYKYKDNYFIIGIGNNKIRKEIYDNYTELKWYTAIHNSAIISENVIIGEGTVIMPGAIVNIGSIIGKHVIINTRASIDHENIIEDFVHISPGAVLAGNVHVKELSWICAGAVVINNIKINRNNVIGAGAVVINDIVDENGIHVGVPVKRSR